MTGTEHADDEQRARLLAGLEESIREKGLAQTQLTDIVRHARASRTTFYKHFTDKDACFVALADQLSSEARTQIREAIAQVDSWEAQVGAGIDASLAAVAAEPALALTFSSASVGPSIVRAQRYQVEQFALLVQDLVAGEAFRQAGIAPISLERAYMLASGLLTTLHRAIERGEDLMPLAPEFKAVFTGALMVAPGGNFADQIGDEAASLSRSPRRSTRQTKSSKKS